MTKLVMALFFSWILSMCIMANPPEGHALSLSLACDRAPSISHRDPFVPPTLEKSEKELVQKKSALQPQKLPKEKGKKARGTSGPVLKPAPGLVLTGVITGEAGNKAIIFDRDRKSSHMVTVGMKMGDYMITAISPGLIVLRGESRSLHLPMGSRN